MSAQTTDTISALVSSLLDGSTSVEKLMAAVKAGKLDALDVIAAVQQYTAKVSAKAGAARELSCKVTEKGGVSVYGLNARFPVTLYADQWERLLAYAPTLTTFIKSNADKCSRKPAA